MHRRPTPLLAALLVLAAALASLVGAPAPAAHAADRDCGDFANQRAAQIFFLDHGGPRSDPHALDSDGDGVACESNPCPCYTGTRPPGGGGTAPEAEPVRRQRARVVKVVDGDTVDVRLLPRGPRERVRLIGIDTPEVYGGRECGGPAASRALKRMLPRGTRVSLVSDRTQDLRDRYDRLLRYVTKLANDADAARTQLVRGNGEVYVYDDTPFVRVRSYRRAEAAAKRADRGIWGRC